MEMQNGSWRCRLVCELGRTYPLTQNRPQGMSPGKKKSKRYLPSSSKSAAGYVSRQEIEQERPTLKLKIGRRVCLPARNRARWPYPQAQNRSQGMSSGKKKSKKYIPSSSKSAAGYVFRQEKEQERPTLSLKTARRVCPPACTRISPTSIGMKRIERLPGL